MPTSKLNPEIISAAIAGFEAQKRRIDEQITELRQMLNPAARDGAAPPAPAKKSKRRISAAGKRAIVEAQRKRWAAVRAAEKTAAGAATASRKKASARKVAAKGPAGAKKTVTA